MMPGSGCLPCGETSTTGRRSSRAWRRLFVNGVNVDWAAFDRGYSRRRVALPTYPFQRQSYWVGEIGFVPGITTQRSDSSASGPLLHPILGRRIEAPIAERIFENTIAANRPSVLGDHRVHGVTVIPCAIFLETALAAAANMEDGPWSIDGFTLIEPLALAGKAEQVLQTIVSPEGSDRRSFRIVTRRNGAAGQESTWVTHATGSFHSVSNLVERTGYSFDPTSLIARISGEPFDAKSHARAMQSAELELGPSYRWVETQWAKNGEALARDCGLRAPAIKSSNSAFIRVCWSVASSCWRPLGPGLPRPWASTSWPAPEQSKFTVNLRRAAGRTWFRRMRMPTASPAKFMFTTTQAMS